MFNNIPFIAISAAEFFGFTCENCGQEKRNFTPIRRGNSEPFFCSILCALDFSGKNGNVEDAEKAMRLRDIFNRFNKVTSPNDDPNDPFNDWIDIGGEN